jgi:dCMP deaminase
MKKRININNYALELAKVAALRSEDPYVKVGCCIIRHDKSVASLGYNGAPAGIELDWSDRKKRRTKVLHAEVNALRYIKPGEAALLACTLLPCNSCIKMITAYNIKTIVYKDIYKLDQSAIKLCKEWNINLIQI